MNAALWGRDQLRLSAAGVETPARAGMASGGLMDLADGGVVLAEGMDLGSA